MDLRPTQTEALHFIGTGRRTIYGDPPGTGKTATSLRYAAETDGRTLVVCPLNVLRHWEAEAAKWIPGYPCVSYRGSDKVKVQQAAVEHWHSQRGILVTNYEAMRRDVDWLGAKPFGKLILDEAHRIKNRFSQTSIAATRLAKKAPCLVHVTGTPVMNRAEELWSMLHMISPKDYKSYWAWVEEHFIVESRMFSGTRWPTKLVGRIRTGHEEQLRQELMGILITRPVYYLLPGLGDEPIVSTLRIDLTTAERKLYDQMAKHGWIADEEGGFIGTDLEISKMTRLRQLSSDWAGLLPNAGLGSKSKAAVALAEDLVEPVVILTAYKATARRIATALNGGLFIGGRGPDDNENARMDFVMGRTKALVGTFGALGVGVDGLQHAARHMIFVDLDYTYDVNRQAIGRLWRSGQTGAVNVWVIAATDTIDQVVAKANEEQRDVKELLTGQPWQDLVQGVV